MRRRRMVRLFVSFRLPRSRRGLLAGPPFGGPVCFWDRILDVYIALYERKYT